MPNPFTLRSKILLALSDPLYYNRPSSCDFSKAQLIFTPRKFGRFVVYGIGRCANTYQRLTPRQG
jgi:hypothetical protein